jgi:hypothetical protein
MSGIKGGIFGQVTGKTGGIVFSKARGRDGVVNTTRTLTKPANPRTTAQVGQRDKFAESVLLARLIGGDYYGPSMNRAIGQLPGYQSLMNLTLNNRDVSGHFDVFPAIRFSNSGGIQGLECTAPDGDTIAVAWSGVVPPGGSEDDIFEVCIYPTNPAELNSDNVQKMTLTRSDVSTNFTVPDSSIGFIAMVTAYNPTKTARQEIQESKKVA